MLERVEELELLNKSTKISPYYTIRNDRWLQPFSV